MFVRILFLIGVIVAGGSLWGGLAYYVTPLTERPFSPLHELYAPTGLIGQGFGIVGTLMILVGVALYMLRKRIRPLSRLGKLKGWLHFHIFMCLLGPFLILLHTTFKFGGLVSIAFWSMALVVASGVFGRWVYVWIPKTLNGRFLDPVELREQMQEMLEEVRGRSRLTSAQITRILGEDPDGEASPGMVAAIGQSLRYALTRRAQDARIQRELSAARVPPAMRREIAARLEDERRARQQLRLIQPFRRAFRYWHAFHLPLAVVMLVILLVHVGVSVAFGYTWIF